MSAAPFAPKPGVHRTTSSSRRGRAMISPGVEHYAHTIPADVAAWNAAVDAKRAAKKAAKRERR